MIKALEILLFSYILLFLIYLLAYHYLFRYKGPKYSEKSIYLCGSMSYVKDYGIKWRKDITKFLNIFNEKVYNPCIEEGSVPQWETIPQSEKERIIKKDLDQIKYNTKAILCYFTDYSTGTVSELTFAYYLNIPIWLISKKKPLRWPGAVVGANGNKWFRSFKEFRSWYIDNRIDEALSGFNTYAR